MNLEEKISSLETEITVLNYEIDKCWQVVQEMASAFGGGGIADMRHYMEKMSLQRAVSNVPVVAHDLGARLWVPEPKAYGGARDAKEVENIILNMEQYFFAANVEDKARKTNQVRLDTWVFLREAIREQFFPENVEYNARRALRKLEHTDSVQDYVKAFSTLMLDIRDMSEKDKLFTFMEGLKPWAQLELQRPRVIDLGSAMTAAERLTDFNLENRRDSGENDSEKDKDNLGVISQWCNTLSHQVATKKTVPLQAGKTARHLTGSHPEEEAQPRNPRKKGLMFVDVKIHGKPICAMIDIGATHNYLARVEVERLGLALEKGVGRVKQLIRPQNLLLKGRKWNESSYLCTLHFEEIEQAPWPIPGVVKKLLKEFEHVMPDELPRKLPMKRVVDQEIELVPNTKHPARAPYRMSQEFRKQLKYFWRAA
ncbi:UNVERIFIED_CONTAM: hypothetical protein Sangu_2172200 [Sesamum angustifolium]|uniref:Retrotransposon gag domain-containing protein n=1 Tax=Sesamum angustifolium TaxID=2727405 RepID=A0AAW2LER9_9LAMI